MEQWHRLLGLLCVGLLLTALVLTGCSELIGSEDDQEGESAGELNPPYHLTAEVGTDGFTVLLTWNMDTAQEYDGFIVERGTASMTPQEIAMVGKTTLSYGDNSELDPGTYIYRVGAMVTSSGIDYCESVSVVIE